MILLLAVALAGTPHNSEMTWLAIVATALALAALWVVARLPVQG